MTDQAQILPGTLDILILKAVSLGPLHGYGVLLRIGQISGQALLIEQGALYPALFRLRERFPGCSDEEYLAVHVMTHAWRRHVDSPKAKEIRDESSS